MKKMNGKMRKEDLIKAYPYEYALYMALSKHFAAVQCNSLCIDRLKLYHRELPRENRDPLEKQDSQRASRPKGRTQEGILREMQILVARDVIGKIHFPMASMPWDVSQRPRTGNSDHAVRF